MGSAGSTSKRMREDIRPDPKPSSGGRPPAESEKMAGGVAGAAAATAAPVVEADAIEEPGVCVCVCMCICVCYVCPWAVMA